MAVTHSGLISVLRIAPRHELALFVAIALLQITVAAYLVLSQPWLGMEFAAGGGEVGIRVVSVAPDSPNVGRVQPGTELLELQPDPRKTVQLNGDMLLEEPDILPYERFNRLLQRQGQVHTLLRSGAVTALTADGDTIELVTDSPPWSTLLGHFAIHVIYSLVALLVALGIWVFKPAERATQLFALSGVAVFVCSLMLGIYGGRELALDATLFRWISSINHLATLLVCAPLAGLFWVYPQPLARLPVPGLLLGLAVLSWVLDLLQVGPGAQYTVYLPVFLGFLAGLGFAAMQWYRTRNRPLDRAALKWCVLAVFLGSSLLMGLIMIPPVFGGKPLVPLVVSFGAYLVLYLGIAAGLQRYRLFDIERWWFKTWLWFLGGLGVLLLDIALVFGAGLASGYALTLSLAAAGWVYFPLRQWLWQRVGQRASVSLDAALQELVDKLFSASSESQILSAWPDLLRRSFFPLRMWSQAHSSSRVRVSSDGSQLSVPALLTDGNGTTLEFAHHGGRLFNPEDVRMASLLYELTGKALQAVRARESGAEAERYRIMRDLHDDLGARLLSVVYASDNQYTSDLARTALADLHGLIDTAAGKPRGLRELVATCESEIRTRLGDAAITLQWHLDNALPERDISARAATNIARILREAISNIIRHAGATTVTVTWQHDATGLRLQVSDNGASTDPSTWPAGGGTRTIRTRAQDLGGHAAWKMQDSQVCVLQVAVPIEV